MSTCNIALLDSGFGMGVRLQEREREDEEKKKGFAFKQLALSPRSQAVVILSALHSTCPASALLG